MIILVILNYKIGYRRDNKARVREKWFECQPVRSYDQQRKDVGISSFQASIYWYRFVVSDLHGVECGLVSVLGEIERRKWYYWGMSFPKNRESIVQTENYAGGRIGWWRVSKNDPKSIEHIGL